MIELVKEWPSPNVALIYNNIDWHERFTRSIVPGTGVRIDHVKCHGKGIFEFTLTGSKAVTDDFVRCVNDVFDVYQEHKQIYNVNVTGAKSKKDISHIASENPATASNKASIGSRRFCNMDPSLAQFFTNLIKGTSTVDLVYINNRLFEMVNVSSYFRFMKYEEGGEHYPHYDSDFRLYDGLATKYSLVAYFSDCDSGELAFCEDRWGYYQNRDDWDRQAARDEIFLKIKPRKLKLVLFPHTLCHAVLPFTDVGKERIMCRGDIIFKEKK